MQGPTIVAPGWISVNCNLHYCDCCSYDAARGISRLAEGWVSLAAAQQRRGRAGRVQPGVCFKLFSHAQAGTMQVRTLCSSIYCMLCSVCEHTCFTSLPALTAVWQGGLGCITEHNDRKLTAVMQQATRLRQQSLRRLNNAHPNRCFSTLLLVCTAHTRGLQRVVAHQSTGLRKVHG